MTSDWTLAVLRGVDRFWQPGANRSNEFNLKLKAYFLRERAQLTTDQIAKLIMLSESGVEARIAVMRDRTRDYAAFPDFLGAVSNVIDEEHRELTRRNRQTASRESAAR